MSGRVVIVEIIRQVGFYTFSVDDEVALLDEFADPVEAHVYGFLSLLIDSAIGNSNCTHVFRIHGGGLFRVAHFFKGDSNLLCLLEVFK